MTAAGGTTTLKRVHTEGEYTVYEISNSDCDSTETITIPTANAQITTSSKVMIVGAMNETTEKQHGDGTLVVAYAAASRAFTPTESGATEDVITIRFRVKG